MSLSEEEIKKAVRQRYSRLATLNESCCGGGVPLDPHTLETTTKRAKHE